MVHDLGRGEDRHGRQHAEGVGGEQHDRLGVGTLGALGHARVAGEGVGEAGVLGDRAVEQVEVLGVGVGHRLTGQGRHVLDQGALHRQGGRDDGLVVLVEIDQLGVAAVLEVGHATLGPDVLVVADQEAVGVGREGRLAGARQAEEDRRVAVGADVGRAVHRQLALGGQHEVHQREHRLLVDAAVVGPTEHQGHPVLDVDDHRTVGEGAVALGVTVERRHVEQRPTGGGTVGVVTDLLREHDVAEVGVGGVLADEAVGLGELRVPATEHVGAVEGPTLGVEMLDDARQQGVELVGVELLEVGLPPDLVGDPGTGDGEGVLRRAARAGGVRVVDERAVDTELGGERLLIVAAAVGVDPTAVVGDGCLEQVVLGQAVADVHALQTESRLELRGDLVAGTGGCWIHVVVSDVVVELTRFVRSRRVSPPGSDQAGLAEA